MKFSRRQLIAIAVTCFALLGAGLFVLLGAPKEKKVLIPEVKTPEAVPVPEVIPETKVPEPQVEVLGLSVEGREVESYTFGNGSTRLVFVGGVHGGYEWNSVLLAYELIDYLESNPESLPANMAVTVIPDANPDGTFKITGKEGRFMAADIPAGANGDGRLNARAVDLNRNFDCNWQSQGVWRQNPVSGGSAAFSEPESAAIRDFVLEAKPAAVIFWHSQSNAIYGSMCGGDMLAETGKIMDVYSQASGYKTVATFDGYQVTGDASDWLASIGVPAMTVELATHGTTEWARNLAGIQALFKYYGNVSAD